MHLNKCAVICGVGAVILWLAGCAAAPARISVATINSASREANPQFDQALVLMRSRHYSEAIPLLEVQARANPTSSVVMLNLAIAQARSGHDAAAEPLLRQVVAQKPGSAVAWNELGMLQRRAGHFVAARQAYAQALAANPKFADVELNLGILFDLYLHQPAQAVPHYQRFQALAATPDKQVMLWIAQLSKAAPSTEGSPPP